MVVNDVYSQQLEVELTYNQFCYLFLCSPSIHLFAVTLLSNFPIERFLICINSFRLILNDFSYTITNVARWMDTNIISD